MAAGSTVYHRQTVQQHAGGQRAEHEVFHGCFGSRRRIARQRHHRVQAQAHQLEPEIQRQKVAGRDHDHHAQRRSQAEHEQFAPEQRTFPAVRAAVDQHRGDGNAHENLEYACHRIVDEHRVESVARPGTTTHRDQRSTRQRKQRKTVAPVAAGVVEEQIDDEYRANHRQQEDLGRGRRQVGGAHRHLSSPAEHMPARLGT